MSTASDVLSLAASYIGTVESPANSNNVIFNTDYYGRKVSGSGYPWCMAFVWDVFRMAGAEDLCIKTAYCPTYESWATAKGWQVGTGQAGDVATMDFGKGRASHIGIIEKRNADGSYTTIEGNTSSTSQDNGGAVMRRVRSTANIRRIFRPRYGGNMAIPFTGDQLKNQVALEYQKAHNGGYRYGNSTSIPPCADHVISCDRLIAVALWDLGMVGQPRGGIVVGNMDAWLVAHGFEKNRSAAAVKANDIVLMGKNGQTVATAAWHAFFVTRYDPATGRCDKYDMGSQLRIQQAQPFRNVPLSEWGDKYFYASYRVPNNNGYLAQDAVEFDYEFYGARWADLLKAFGWNQAKLLDHFSRSGMKEGRRANVLFDPQFYANKYKDLWSAFGDKWQNYFDHFYKYGMKEGRTPSEMFELSFYKAKYPDLVKAFGSNNIRYYNHFVSHGMKEGRQACKSFDPKAYRKRYKDLDKAYGNNWSAYYRHWVIYGKKEGRKGT